MKTLVWFRSDLRLRDNPALYKAVREGDGGTSALFVLTPGQWKDHDWGDARVEFLLHNLESLSRNLGEWGIPFAIKTVDRFGDVPGLLVRHARKVKCDALFFNREHEWNERRRDDQVEIAFREAGVPVYPFTDQMIVEPEDLRTGSGGPYSVYTPFRRRLVERLADSEALHPLPRPRRRADLSPAAAGAPRKISGFRFAGKITELWPAGERAAQKRLKKFLESGGAQYGTRRDHPADDGTSRLSPYLALGVLSPRETLSKAIAANGGRLQGGKGGLATWINQLIWREFYRHVMVGFPRVSRGRSFQPAGDTIPWRHDEAGLKAWTEGRTGIPIIDAGMRQMQETGWMHNRLRMVTAMFLTKHLLIDWREGERHFMRHLVDGDLANNNGGWQWSASTGTDAAPYFRIFNPWTQSKRFDPDGDFIRRFIPELRDVPAADLHNENRMRQLPRLLSDYPEPIVEHRGARERAIDTFQAVLGKGGRKRERV